MALSLVLYGIQEPDTLRQRHGLQSAMNIELAEKILDVIAHRSGGYEEKIVDFVCSFALGEQTQHLGLTGGQA